MVRRSLGCSILGILIVSAVFACGGAGLLGEPFDAGRGTRGDVLDAVPLVLRQYGYAVARTDDRRTRVYFETSWQTRAPFADEEREGLIECRTRVTVEARWGANDLYAVTMRAESIGLRGADLEWSPIGQSTMVAEHLAEMAREIRIRIDAGLRRVGG